MVVVAPPSVKGCGALTAVAVDRAVGPTAEQRADESLRLAVRLRSVGASAQVTNAQSSAGDRMDRRAIAGSIVREQLLHGHPVALKVGDRAPQEPHHGD